MNVNILKNRLHDYLNGNFSREKLIEWGSQSLINILKTREDLPLECLFTYPFLSRISIDTNSWESINHKMIKEYFEILNGEKNFSYLFITKLKGKRQGKELLDIEKILNNYIRNGKFREQEYTYIQNYIEKNQTNDIFTLFDMIQCDIINHLEGLPEMMNQELDISTLFIEDEIKSSINQVSIIQNMVKACYGKVNVHVNLYYTQNGNTLSLQVETVGS